jgi:tetratricopeptide (TPR) repeat protein
MSGYAEVFASIQARKFGPALASLDKMIGAGTRNAQSLSLRGTLLEQLDRYDEADIALDAALALDSRNPAAISGKARLLLRKGRSEDALILLDRLVLLMPDSPASYEQRAEARANSGQYDGALADLAIVLEKQPDNQQARIGRVRIFNSLGERDKALAETDAFVKLLPDSAGAHSLRGNVLAWLGRGPEASQELARSLAIAPSADAYIIRLTFDLSGDDKARLADMLASIRLAPERSLPSRPLAKVVADAEALAQLTAAYDAAIAKDREKAEELGEARDSVFAAAGHPEALLARYDRAVASKPEDPVVRNTACWFRATHKLQLDKALADCDAAIRIRHDAAFLDSRGLVQLQRGEYAKAIADYDAALALRPLQAGSLFGRGVAKARAGDPKGSAADLAAARKASDRTEGEYADYGIKP